MGTNNPFKYSSVGTNNLFKYHVLNVAAVLIRKLKYHLVKQT